MPPRKIDSEKAKVEKQAKVDTQKKIDFLFVCIQKCVPFKPDWDAVGEIFKISAADAEKQLSDWRKGFRMRRVEEAVRAEGDDAKVPDSELMDADVAKAPKPKVIYKVKREEKKSEKTDVGSEAEKSKLKAKKPVKPAEEVEKKVEVGKPDASSEDAKPKKKKNLAKKSEEKVEENIDKEDDNQAEDEQEGSADADEDGDESEEVEQVSFGQAAEDEV